MYYGPKSFKYQINEFRGAATKHSRPFLFIAKVRSQARSEYVHPIIMLKRLLLRDESSCMYISISAMLDFWAHKLFDTFIFMTRLPEQDTRMRELYSSYLEISID